MRVQVLFDVAVRQYPVKECVVKTPSGNLHTKLIADGKVTRRQSSRMMVLTESSSRRSSWTRPSVTIAISIKFRSHNDHIATFDDDSNEE